MITLFGATGYTGRLVANHLANLDLPPNSIRLAGRDAESLEEMAVNLPYHLETIVADASKPDTLHALFPGTRVLINCAGPFTDLGEAVVSLAALHGVHYLDTTNELGYVYRMSSYDKLAKQNGAAIVPACAFEVAVADCAASVLAEETTGPIDSMNIAYALSGGQSSYATRRSAIRSLGTSWLAYKDGKWTKAIPCTATRTINLPRGNRAAISFPSSETATMPQHLDVKNIHTWMVVSRRIRWVARMALPFFAMLARTPIRGLMESAATSLQPAPNNENETESKWLVKLEMVQSGSTQSMILTGESGYETTGKIAAYAAGKMLAPDYDKKGVLAPARALNPKAFLDYAVESMGVSITHP